MSAVNKRRRKRRKAHKQLRVDTYRVSRSVSFLPTPSPPTPSLLTSSPSPSHLPSLTGCQLLLILLIVGLPLSELISATFRHGRFDDSHLRRFNLKRWLLLLRFALVGPLNFLRRVSVGWCVCVCKVIASYLSERSQETTPHEKGSRHGAGQRVQGENGRRAGLVQTCRSIFARLPPLEIVAQETRSLREGPWDPAPRVRLGTCALYRRHPTPRPARRNPQA